MARETGLQADGSVILPDFEVLRRQPDLPHNAHVLEERMTPNRHGTLICYTVRENRKGTAWSIEASLDGMRVSNTLRTTKFAVRLAWVKAVVQGRVSVAPLRIAKRARE